MYEARRISRAEYVIFATTPIESIHEFRCAHGAYDHDLEPVKAAITAIEEKYGLLPNEYWTVADAPIAYKRLSAQYSRILDQKFIQALNEFGLHDLAILRRDKPRVFERLRERGRRSVFHADDTLEALIDQVLVCERDVGGAARANAFLAAIISLGAGLEDCCSSDAS